jgi:hypothetical protein
VEGGASPWVGGSRDAVSTVEQPANEATVGGPTMKLRSLRIRHFGAPILSLSVFGLTTSAAISEESKFFIKPVVKRKLKSYRLDHCTGGWRFSRRSSMSRTWRRKDMADHAQTQGWIHAGRNQGRRDRLLPPVSASEYLLRVNRAGGAPGTKTLIHTHPGSEAFYVLTGKLGQKTPHGVTYTEAGMTMTGHGPDTPMEGFDAGTTDLDKLAIFVVDTNRPFSSPASLD